MDAVSGAFVSKLDKCSGFCNKRKQAVTSLQSPVAGVNMIITFICLALPTLTIVVFSSITNLGEFSVHTNSSFVILGFIHYMPFLKRKILIILLTLVVLHLEGYVSLFLVIENPKLVNLQYIMKVQIQGCIWYVLHLKTC